MRIEATALSGGNTAIVKLRRVGTNAGSLRPLAERLHRELTRAIEYQFDHNGIGEGGWRPVTDRWLERKRRTGLDVRTMHATLALRRSLTNETDANHVWRIERSGVTLSSRLPYARYLARAGRDPVVITRDTRKQVSDIVRDHLLSGVGGNG